MTVVTKEDWLDTRPWIDRPDADVDAYVDALAEEPAFDLRAQLKQWQQDGLVIIERAVDTDLLDAYVADIEYVKSHPQYFELSVDMNAVRRPIREVSREELAAPGIKFNHMHTISGNAVRLSLTRAVSEFLAHVFRTAPCVLQSLTSTGAASNRYTSTTPTSAHRPG